MSWNQKGGAAAGAFDGDNARGARALSARQIALQEQSAGHKQAMDVHDRQTEDSRYENVRKTEETRYKEGQAKDDKRYKDGIRLKDQSRRDQKSYGDRRLALENRQQTHQEDKDIFQSKRQGASDERQAINDDWKNAYDNERRLSSQQRREMIETEYLESKANEEQEKHDFESGIGYLIAKSLETPFLARDAKGDPIPGVLSRGLCEIWGRENGKDVRGAYFMDDPKNSGTPLFVVLEGDGKGGEETTPHFYSNEQVQRFYSMNSEKMGAMPDSIRGRKKNTGPNDFDTDDYTRMGKNQTSLYATLSKLNPHDDEDKALYQSTMERIDRIDGEMKALYNQYYGSSQGETQGQSQNGSQGKQPNQPSTDSPKQTMSQMEQDAHNAAVQTLGEKGYDRNHSQYNTYLKELTKLALDEMLGKKDQGLTAKRAGL